MRKFTLIFLLLICSSHLMGQDGFVLFPEGINFLPLRANIEEPRLGVMYFPDNANLKVDIGNSSDLIGYKWDSGASFFTMGIDFMAYGLASSFAGNRLQIDALDGFFGGNASFTRNYGDYDFQIRARIIHNSAHLVDGSYNLSADEWRNKRYPVAYTRDFGEVTTAFRKFSDSYDYRIYGSVSYSTLVRPGQIKKYAFNTGAEFNFDTGPKVGGKQLKIISAYHMSLEGTPEYQAVHHIMAGVKFGGSYNKGVVFYISYFAGKNMFSEYFEENIKKLTAGFFVDF